MSQKTKSLKGTAKRKKATKTPQRGKVSVKGYTNYAKQAGLLIIGICGAYAAHQLYTTKIRPDSLTPNATQTTSGLLGTTITYAEPVAISIIGLTLMQFAKNDAMKAVWLGASVYGGAIVANNVGRDFFKTNLLGSIADAEPMLNVYKENKQLPAPEVKISFPERVANQEPRAGSYMPSVMSDVS
jgi:hypothetical protein